MLFKEYFTWLARNYESRDWKGQKYSLLSAIPYLIVGALLGYLSHFIFPESSTLKLIGISVVASFAIFVCILLFAGIKYGSKETNYRIAIDEAEKQFENKESLIYARFEPYFDKAEEIARKTQNPTILNTLMKDIEAYIGAQKMRYEFQRELNEKSDPKWVDWEIEKLKRETAVRLTQLREALRETGGASTKLNEEIDNLFNE